MKNLQSLLFALFLLGLSSVVTSASAATEYQSSEDFITQSFNGHSGTSEVIWIDDDAKQVIESILSHSFNKMRLRYSAFENQTVWIMEEIGKESMITVGIHVKDNQIAKTKVLVYRESRGDEVRHDFFTNQFISAKLGADLQLDKHIDGITGATLSVRALTKLSRIALWLDAHIRDKAENN